METGDIDCLSYKNISLHLYVSGEYPGNIPSCLRVQGNIPQVTSYVDMPCWVYNYTMQWLSLMLQSLSLIIVILK